ncbi:hypothetical protein HY496_01635 [Candidatus Woesearchaeota archaeon]|nr:hypothetical protein [Candidatus Woesearchaeota archaeon]
MKFIRALFSDSTVEKKYVHAGAIFGGAVSYLYLGERTGFKSLLNKWAKWEEEYASRGFRTVSLDRFIDFGGWGVPIDDVIGQRRANGEEAIFHAQIYRTEFLGKVAPAIDLEKMMRDGEPQIVVGTYRLPSTERVDTEKD